MVRRQFEPRSDTRVGVRSPHCLTRRAGRCSAWLWVALPVLAQSTASAAEVTTTQQTNAMASDASADSTRASSPTAPTDLSSPAESTQGVPSIIRLPMAAPAHAPLTLATSVDYGFYPKVTGEPERTRRGGAQFFLAWAPSPLLTLRAGLVGVLGMVPNTAGSYYGEPQLGARWLTKAASSLYVGADLEARLVGATAPSIKPSATTPTLSGLVGWHAAGNTWLGARLGYRLDRTAQAVDGSERFRVRDRLILGASSWDAALLGVGASQLVGRTELLAEASAELLVGSGAPSLRQSPWGGALGVRYHYDANLGLIAFAHYSGTRLPNPFPEGALLPVRPQLSVELGIHWRFGVHDLPASPPPEASSAAPTSGLPLVARATHGVVFGTVVDEGGRPMPDVAVTVKDASGQASTTYTDATGKFRFDQIRLGAVVLTTDTANYDPATRKVKLEKAETKAGELLIYPALPAGQVKGRTLNLKGAPVLATVTFEPGGKTLETSADGAFSIDLKPGVYTVRVTHPDFSPQVRTIRVEERGVVVLDIALNR